MDGWNPRKVLTSIDVQPVVHIFAVPPLGGVKKLLVEHRVTFSQKATQIPEKEIRFHGTSAHCAQKKSTKK